MTARNSSPPWMTGKSRDRTAPMIRRPTPGMANTCSITTALPSSAPTMMPITVTIGIIAFVRPCRMTTYARAAPWRGGPHEVLAEHFQHAGARHARDESHLHAGERERGQRDMPRPLRRDFRRMEHSRRREQPSRPPRLKISTRPSQNSGIESPSSASGHHESDRRRVHGGSAATLRPRRRATTEKTKARAASDSVTGSRSRIDGVRRD